MANTLNVLIVVDVQNGFISQDGLEHEETLDDIYISINQVKNIEKLMDSNKVIIFSRDMHPLGHASFQKYRPHCRNNLRVCENSQNMTADKMKRAADPITILANFEANKIKFNESNNLKQTELYMKINPDPQLSDVEFLEKYSDEITQFRTDLDTICSQMKSDVVESSDVELSDTIKTAYVDFNKELNDICLFIKKYKVYIEFLAFISLTQQIDGYTYHYKDLLINGYELSYLFLGTIYKGNFCMLNILSDKYALGLNKTKNTLHLGDPDSHNIVLGKTIRVNTPLPSNTKLIELLNKGEYCNYDSYSAFNYHTKFENGNMSNIQKNTLRKQFSTGLYERIIKLATNSSINIQENFTLNITVCGLSVIHTIMQGIVFWRQNYRPDHKNITINFIYDISGTIFSKYSNFKQSYEINDFKDDKVIEQFRKFFDEIITRIQFVTVITFEIKYLETPLFTYTFTPTPTPSSSQITPSKYKYNKYKQKYLNLTNKY